MNSAAPVFQTVLGSDWTSLGDIVQRHYFLRPHSTDYMCVTGEMIEIHHSTVAKLVIPIGLLFGAVVPYRGSNVPTDVHYNSSTDNSNIYWDRVFKFDSGHFHFRSHMEPLSCNEVIEFVRFGLGVRLHVSTENGALVFREKGYLWRIFGYDLPIPGRWLMGRVYVEERPIDDDHFSMKMTLTHPAFGELFRYSGKFQLRTTS